MSRPMWDQESPICVSGDDVDESIRGGCSQNVLKFPELHNQEELDISVLQPTVISKLFGVVQRLTLAGFVPSTYNE